MSFLENLELPRPKIGPEFMLGAASPLWGYFAGAAMTGMTYWWMTRMAQPANMEAAFAAVVRAVRVSEINAQVTPTLVEAAAEATPPVGGEAAPVSPVAAIAEPPVEAAALADAIPDTSPPANERAVAPVEPASFAEPTPQPKSRRTPAGASAPTPDA